MKGTLALVLLSESRGLLAHLPRKTAVVSSPITFPRLRRRVGTLTASIARGKFMLIISSAWNVPISYSMPPILLYLAVTSQV